MSETKNLDLTWLETLDNPTSSQIIFIRHGESMYSEQGYDLTDIGIEQVRKTARSLKDHVNKFDSVLIVCSPANRAKGSMFVYWEESGVKPNKVKTLKDIRPLDIKDIGAFLQYNDLYSTNRYGEMWLTDDLFKSDNQIAEGRDSVNRRAIGFLDHFGRAIKRLSDIGGCKVCVLAFTHFEIANNFLQGIFGHDSRFPVDKVPVLQNAEPVILSLDSPKDGSYTLFARGISKKVHLDLESNRLK